LGVTWREFAVTSQSSVFGVWFSVYLWPLPRIARRLRNTEFAEAILDYSAHPREPVVRPLDKPPHFVYTGESDREVRTWQLAEAAKVIEELRAADPEREGNAAAVRFFVQANKQGTFGKSLTQGTDHSGSFSSPFGERIHRPWYRASWGQIIAWPNRLWQWWRWL
jgi:hypothetical protein